MGDMRGAMTDLLCSGHAACPGCLEALSLRHVLAVLGPDTVGVIPPSCLAIMAGPQPLSGLRIPVYQQIEAILLSEVPVIPLVWMIEADPMTDRLRGYRPSPTITAGDTWNVQRWWLAAPSSS